MAYDQQPQTEYSETSTEMRFALAIGTLAAAVNIGGALYQLPSMAAFDWIIVWRAAAEFAAWAGGAYAACVVILAVAPGLPALLLKEAQDATGLNLSQPKRELPTGQPKREKPQRLDFQVLPLGEDDDLDLLPQWISNTDRMVWGDRLNINGKVMDAPNGFNSDWLYTVAENRWNGKLATISTVALHSIGIERFGNGDTPASIVLAIFEDAGIITRAGERQPFTWTEAGKRAFPYPAENT